MCRSCRPRPWRRSGTMSMLTSASATALNTLAAYPGCRAQARRWSPGPRCGRGATPAVDGLPCSLIDPTAVPGLSEQRPDAPEYYGGERSPRSAASAPLGAAGRHLEHFEGHGVELGVAHDAVRVGAEDAVHVGVDLTDIGTQRRPWRRRWCPEPPRPNVVTSLVSWRLPLELLPPAPPQGRFGAAPAHVDDLGVAVSRWCITPACEPRTTGHAPKTDGHGHQRISEMRHRRCSMSSFLRRRRRAHLLAQDPAGRRW